MLTLAGLAIVVVLLYFFGTKSFGYWEKKGVKHDKPIPFFGTTFGIFIQKISDSNYFSYLYDKCKHERFVGFYIALRPALLLRDPDLAKSVMTTDFNHFYSRGVLHTKEIDEPILKNLFFADGDLWKLLRQRMTSAFTSGKLKAMFPLIVDKTGNLLSLAEDSARSGKEVDVRDLMARYTTDFIGTVGFGIDSDSLNDENSHFRKVGKRIFKITYRDAFIGFIKTLFPEALRKIPFMDPMIERNIYEILKAVLKERNYKPSGRNDFIDQLMELKEKGKICVQSVETKNSDGSAKMVELDFDEQLMVGQMFVFFAAGFETSSSATSYTLHQLAYHPEVQQKCQQEIDEVLSRYDNKLCYDAIAEMKYLNLTFNEGIRLWPSLGFLQRRCNVPYRIPGTDVTIDEGVDIVIPVHSLHHDEKYYDEPEKFMPERFLPENKRHHKFAYLPFGDGPRACIGERLGLMQSLAGLAALLSRFSVEPSESTVRKPVADPKSGGIQSVLGGLPLRIVERKTFNYTQ